MPDSNWDAPIEDKHRAKMQALARHIDGVFNGKVGFCLMVFPFSGGPGGCSIVSNARREDVAVLLKEQAAYFAGMPEATGRG
jgi:hypothetical protein